MKILTFVFFVLLMMLLSFEGKSQNYFDYTYNFGDIEQPLAIVTDSAENIYVCGWFEDSLYQIPHAFVLKTDADGQELWRVTLSDTSKFYALCLIHDGNLAIAGSRNNRCFLTLLDSQTGSELWANEQSGSDNFWLATINEIVDSGNYKLFVRKEVNGAHKIRYLLFGSSNGNLLLEYINVNTVYGVAYTSLEIDSSQVWTAGNTDENTGLIWDVNFGPGISYYWSFSTVHIAGLHPYSDNFGSEVDYFKSSDGKYFMGVLTIDLTYFNTWGNAFEIEHSQDHFTVTGSDKYETGKFVITGTIDNELALWFIDHDLTEMDDKTIPTQYPRTGIDVVVLPSTDMILMGTELPDTSSNATDVFLMKLNQYGLVSTPEHQLSEAITIYPNPATNWLYIKSNGHNLNHVKAYMVNSMGQTVKTITNLNCPLDLSGIPNGLYVLVVYDNLKLLSRQKFVKK